MSNIYLYAHGGSGNHGCEAIVRSTIRLVNVFSNNKIVLFSSRPEEDRKYGISELCEVVNETTPYSKCSLSFLRAYLRLKLQKDYLPMDKMKYQNTFKRMMKGDIAISIGGDNYCYKDVDRYIMLHDLALERQTKTVLWGCSVEPELIKDPKIARDLSRYSLIVARESISYEALKMVNPNTVLIPDPAFTLNYEKPEIFSDHKKRDFVGLNISPMVLDQEAIPGITMQNYQRLIDNIIDTTDMEILLIPHVIWAGNDDREPLSRLYDLYKKNDRVHLVEDQDCTKLKAKIACCRFFVGARTHSTIAAYSTGIPTIVVGYSVKARGIAKDLFGTDKHYVVPVQSLSDEDELLKAFQWGMAHEMKIREKLQKVTGESVVQKYTSVAKYLI